MHKQKNMGLNDDGELMINVPSQRNRSAGCLKLLLFIIYTVVLIVVTAVVAYLSVETVEDIRLQSWCKNQLVLDIVSNPAVLRDEPSRKTRIVGYVEKGFRYLTLGRSYNKRLNDCWVLIDVDGTKGWVLTLLDKQY